MNNIDLWIQAWFQDSQPTSMPFMFTLSTPKETTKFKRYSSYEISTLLCTRLFVYSVTYNLICKEDMAFGHCRKGPEGGAETPFGRRWKKVGTSNLPTGVTVSSFFMAIETLTMDDLQVLSSKRSNICYGHVKNKR